MLNLASYKPVRGLLLRPVIVSIQVKISSTSKTFDMSDFELGPEAGISPGLSHLNILFCMMISQRGAVCRSGNGYHKIACPPEIENITIIWYA